MVSMDKCTNVRSTGEIRRGLSSVSVIGHRVVHDVSGFVLQLPSNLHCETST